MSKNNTAERILDAAREILASQGLSALSFDAVARRLGHSKQAVLYWYPTRQELLAALFLPCLEAEAEAARAALEAVPGPAGQGPDDAEAAAITAFVRAVAAFHLADLDRFRLMYLSPQTLRRGGAAAAGPGPGHAPLLQRVHPVTDRLYGALAGRLRGGDPAAARRRAVAIHGAVLGLVLMVGLSGSLNDPLKHDTDALVEALVRQLQGRHPPGAG